jgi:hypothetical protein
VGIPARLTNAAGVVVFEGYVELGGGLTVGIPFHIGNALVVGDIGQVTINPADGSAVPLDVLSQGTALFRVGQDGTLHGKTGKGPIAFDL